MVVVVVVDITRVVVVAGAVVEVVVVDDDVLVEEFSTYAIPLDWATVEGVTTLTAAGGTYVSTW